MARQASTKGGQATSLVDLTFDPREITLNEYIDLYIEKAESSESWGNPIKNNPVFKRYLDRPVIDLFDAANDSESGNLLADAQNALEKDSARANLQSRIRTIENSGVLAKIDRIDAVEKTNLAEDYVSLSDNVAKLKTRGNRATSKTQFNSSKIGTLVNNLVEHVKKFPNDVPIANAILMNLETGSRPSLMLGLRSTDFIQNQTDEAVQAQGIMGSDGLLIPPDRTGAKSSSERKSSNRPYSTPISKRASTILQSQSQYLRDVPWANKAIPGLFFQVLDEKTQEPRMLIGSDINRVLNLVTPPGLVRENTTDKGQVDSTKPLTSKDLRKLQIQAMNSVGVSRENQAMLLSRDVGGASGAQDLYIGEAGNYNQPSVDDLNKASQYMWNQYTFTQPGGKEAVKAGRTLSPSTFIFKPPSETPEFINFNEAVPDSAPVMSTPFSAPVEASSELSDAPFTENSKLNQNVDTYNLEIDLKNRGLDLKSLLSNTAKSAVAVGAVVGPLAKKAGAAILPGVGFSQTRDEFLERGDSPLAATAQAVVEEVIPSAAVSRVVSEAVIEPLGEEIKSQVPEEGILSGIGRALTGEGMNFNTGGFVDIDRGPEAAPATQPDQGFLSR